MVSQNPGPEQGKNARFTNDSSLPYNRVQRPTLLTSPGPSWESYQQGDQQYNPSRDIDHLTNFDQQYTIGNRPNTSFTAQHDGIQVGAIAPLPSFHPNAFFSGSSVLHQGSDFNPFPPPLPPSDSPSWDNFTPSTSNFTASIDTPSSDSRYGGFDNMAWSPPDTLGSDISEGFPFSAASSYGNSPTDRNGVLVDQILPGGYFEYAEHYPQNPLDSPRYSKKALVGIGHSKEMAPWDVLDRSGGQEFDPSEELMFNQPTEFEYIEQSPNIYQRPWNTQHIDSSAFAMHANSGSMAFAPERGQPYRAYKERERLFQQSSPASQLLGSEGSQFDGSNSSELWRPSPPREVTPSTSDGESMQGNSDNHWHILSAENGFEVPSSQENLPRRLSPQRRREILAVRKNHACWACHLSKIRCSPCSPGSPCQKCASLIGKRRFCRVPCFNDPIETLYPFLIPDLLNGHLTKTNVESFIEKHTLRWGKNPLQVQMSWGSQRLLTAHVVQLFPREEKSEIALQHQAISNGTARPTIVRQNSPPLGIPLASVPSLQKKYQKYVQEVVREDLAQYPSAAYSSQTSPLSQRLLRAVCTWYQSGVAAGEKCALTESAIEIHIIETMLERSLILDKASIDQVQTHLGQEFLPRSSPRCAQRQIKLILFKLQRPRIVRVLEHWGKLMRNTASSNDKWATTICVFVLLTLLMDQLITSAYYVYQDQVKYYAADEKGAREELQELVRLMETKLFEQCKEIFHSRYKTRKGSNERFNPVRDGLSAWRKSKGRGGPDERTGRLVSDLQAVMDDFGQEILPPSSRISQEAEQLYTNRGRLASIFLADFLA